MNIIKIKMIFRILFLITLIINTVAFFYGSQSSFPALQNLAFRVY
jgi:hypothetical protein